MARGPSGRIVVEVETSLKAALYEALARDQLTMREWLIRQATSYVEGSRQPSLFTTLQPKEHTR